MFTFGKKIRYDRRISDSQEPLQKSRNNMVTNTWIEGASTQLNPQDAWLIESFCHKVQSHVTNLQVTVDRIEHMRSGPGGIGDVKLKAFDGTHSAEYVVQFAALEKQRHDTAYAATVARQLIEALAIKTKYWPNRTSNA